MLVCNSSGEDQAAGISVPEIELKTVKFAFADGEKTVLKVKIKKITAANPTIALLIITPCNHRIST
jgi:hypothetical protein